MKKTLAIILSILIMVSAVCLPSSGGLTAEAASFTDMNQSQITSAMGLGWNLGNSLEANSNGTPSETAWGNPTVTSAIFNAVKAAGFSTVRIPVSWLSYIGNGSSYTVSSAWMSRVKEVVDMAIAADLYVVINVHGDGYSTVTGGWLLPGASDQTTIKAKFKSLWTQIATTFKDYDHHLIFEGMNEIGADANYDWETVNNYYTNINDYNQIFIDAVRATGGNNTKRWLIITGWNTNIDYTTNQWLNFQLPTDSYNSSPRLMISVHYYSPWEFCGNESYDVVNWGSSASSSVATWGNEDYMVEQLQLMYNNFVSAGYPAFIGEFGCIDKGNTSMRVYWAQTFVKYCKQYGCIPVWWDNGWNGTYGFALFDRSSGSQTQSAIINAMVSAIGGSSSGTTTTTQATTTTTKATTTTTQATTTTTKATTTTTQASSGSSSNADNYVITIATSGSGASTLKYLTINGYHLSVSGSGSTHWENCAVSGSATIYVPKSNAYNLTVDFKSSEWGTVIASWSGAINSDITLTFNGSTVSASSGSSGSATTTTTTTKATTTTTKATTTTTKATTTTTKATTTTTKATTTTTKATTASSSSSSNYAVTINTTGNGSALKYLMINGYHLSISDGSGTYWENAAVSGTAVIYIPKTQSWNISIDFKTSEWGSSSASWSGTVTSDITLTFDGSNVTVS